MSAGRAADGRWCGSFFRADVPLVWGYQTPDRGAQAATPEARARCRNELFPVFPVDLRLFPVALGTENLNDDNGLHAFFEFVPSVPTKSGRHPEGTHSRRTLALPVAGGFGAALEGGLLGFPWLWHWRANPLCRVLPGHPSRG